MKQLAVFQNKPFAFRDNGMNHLCRYWDKHILTIVENNFFNHCAQWLPLVNKRFVINVLITISIAFFDLVSRTTLPSPIAFFQ
jgi:hypothetical protein